MPPRVLFTLLVTLVVGIIADLSEHERQIRKIEDGLDHLTYRTVKLQNDVDARNEQAAGVQRFYSSLNTAACRKDEFQCGGDDPQCISDLLVCDGYKDCRNGVDEKECSLPFRSGDKFIVTLANFDCGLTFSRNLSFKVDSIEISNIFKSTAKIQVTGSFPSDDVESDIVRVASATGSYNLATRLLELIFVSLGEKLIWSLNFNDHTMQVVIGELTNVCGKATFTMERNDESISESTKSFPDSSTVPKREPFGILLGKTDGGVDVLSCNYETLNKSEWSDLSWFDAKVDGVYTGFKWQCVELARRYLLINFGVVFESIPMAYHIFDLKCVTRVKDKALFRLHTFTNGSSVLPVKGSLLIWRPVGEFKHTGHVAVIVDVTSTHVDIVEQNVDDAIWPAGQTYSRRLRVTRDVQTEAFHIFCTFPDTELIGWINLALDEPYVEDQSECEVDRFRNQTDILPWDLAQQP